MPTFRVIAHPRLPDMDACWTFPSAKRFTSRDEADRYAEMLADSVWASVVQEEEEATLDGITVLNGYDFKPGRPLFLIHAGTDTFLVVALSEETARMRVYARLSAQHGHQSDTLYRDMTQDAWDVEDVQSDAPLFRLMLAYARVSGAMERAASWL